ncbi:MAG: tRNA (adenosine(37)-N6)-threonylcarbamoyltransferase complex dimerization subunit type 1 TsaB [Verrucomicrobiota bacterium]|nr:tRNA (adenosine(37)-N6)-threonylcarbamoyltransferase complex dimerization subunit type 1 TsaB [Verrucomicrobiota bacterium]
MKILALELSSHRGSIARADDGDEMFASEFANDRQHSGAFFEKLSQVTKQCEPADVIVVGLGPGSYAGVRIAIAAAIGLGAATNARLIGLPSICAIPTNATRYAVVGDARRQTFYYAAVSDRECTEGPVLLSEVELRGRLDDLDGTPVYATELLPTFEQVETRAPSASILAQLVARAPLPEISVPLEPLYLRAPHITASKQPAPIFNVRAL